ncbi:hypothetical protein [Brevundimonas bacteroides]|uniref:hypothetical protein n=1 Tax=Brevundimonas bacteroides TaxID=74311 RepID=UPI00068A9A76|nr:hypothetical protein [Brevundimonas bacteroides]
MAIAALFLRLATVLSLKGQTMAGDRVSDSAILPVDQRIADQRRPALVVYTDDFAADQVEGRDLLTGQRALQISIEIVVADQVERTVEGEGGPQTEISVSIPETDQGLELQLDLLERQVLRVLQADGSPWPELWRSMIGRVRKVECQRGAGFKEGVRFAARQLLLTVQPLPEPGFGRAAEGIWRRVLDALQGEPDLQDLVPLLEAEISGEALPDWRVAQGLLGLTREGVEGIGLAPPFDAALSEDAPLLSRITIAGDDADRVIDPPEE